LKSWVSKEASYACATRNESWKHNCNILWLIILAEGSLEFRERAMLVGKRKLWLRCCLVKYGLQQRGMAFNSSYGEDLPPLAIL